MKIILAVLALFSASVSFAQKNDSIYTAAQQPADFIGGYPAMMKFVNRNLTKEAKSAGLDGMIHILFIVEKDSTLSNLQLLRE